MSEYYNSQKIRVTSPSDYVLLVELARKPVNAFNEEFWSELGHVFDKINEDGNIRAVVLASALPKIFTAGLDLNDAGALQDNAPDSARKALFLRQHILKFQSAISSIERCRFPVIVAIHGLSLGLGIDIASACDIRFAAADASFSIKEVDIGLAADIGTLARLPKAVGNQSLARELAYTARPFTATEAFELGFISKVVPGGQKEVIAAALDTARLIAQKSPIAVTGTKHLLLHSRDHTVAENLEYTATWNSAQLQTSDAKDLIAAFKTKVAPKFANLPKL